MSTQQRQQVVTQEVLQ